MVQDWSKITVPKPFLAQRASGALRGEKCSYFFYHSGAATIEGLSNTAVLHSPNCVRTEFDCKADGEIQEKTLILALQPCPDSTLDCKTLAETAISPVRIPLLIAKPERER